MLVDMIGDRVLRPHRRGQHEGQLVLSDDVARADLAAGFGSGISEALKAKRGLVKMRGLLGVADIEFDVIGALERQEILLRLVLGLHPVGYAHFLGFWFSGRCAHKNLSFGFPVAHHIGCANSQI